MNEYVLSYKMDKVKKSILNALYAETRPGDIDIIKEVMWKTGRPREEVTKVYNEVMETLMHGM